MYKNIKAKRMVEQEYVTDKECRCDACKKLIFKESEINPSEKRFPGPNTDTVSFWAISTHHNDWGDASWESYENSHVCSKECLAVILMDYLEESSKDLPNSQVIEVQHVDYCYKIGKESDKND